MKKLGIETIGGLSRFDVQRLIEAFGKKLGVYFHKASIGLDNEPVRERGEAESISKISTLKNDTRNFKEIMEKVNQLCDEVYARLLQREIMFKSVGLIVVASDMSIHTRSKTLESPANTVEVLKKIVEELLERFLNESEKELRRIGVKTSNFLKKHQVQKRLTFFDGFTID